MFGGFPFGGGYFGGQPFAGTSEPIVYATGHTVAAAAATEGSSVGAARAVGKTTAAAVSSGSDKRSTP